MVFGQVISTYLACAKLSVVQLSKKLNISKDYIEDWLKGISYPKWKQRNWILRTIEFSGVVDDDDGFHFEGTGKPFNPGLTKKFQTTKGRQKYYESKTFDKLKDEVAKRSKNKCEICGCPGSGSDGRKGLTVHHLVYNNDFGTGKEDLNELVDVCYYHHSMLHSVDSPEKAKAYKEFKDGVYKVLLIPHKDGSYNIKLFHDECNDTDIKAYFNQLMRKVKFKPKYYILSLGNQDNINKLKVKDFSYITDNRSNTNIDRIKNRSEGHCELCGGKLEVIYNLQTKNNTFDSNTPTYSLLGLCKQCATKLASRKTIQTNNSVKLIVIKNKDSYSIKGVKGNIKDSEIKEKIKGNYTIEGPFYITDIISSSKLDYYLSNNKKRK